MSATALSIATEVLAALDAGRQIDLFSARQAGLTVAQAYAVAGELRQLRLARGDATVGRKIGFTNRGIWDEYKVFQPIWGDMWASTVFDVLPGARIAVSHLLEPRIEPEIVLALAGDIAPGMSVDEIAARIDWIAHGFEIVQSIYPDWRFQAADCIADGGLHGILLVGPRIPAGDLDRAGLVRALASLQVTLLRDGSEIDRGIGANALDGPVEALRHLAETLRDDAINPPVRAGEIITTGTLTRAFPIRAGETWTTRIDGMGLAGMDVTFA